MIRYDYICQGCNHELKDIMQSIKDKPKKSCPKCGKHKLERVIYGGVYGLVENTNTIGKLADKNTKNMGHYELSELEAQKSSPLNPYGENAKATRSEINCMSEAQRKNYITEGKK